MSSVDSRSLFVSGGEVPRAEVHASSGIFGIFILFILEKSLKFENASHCTVYTGAHCAHGVKVRHFEIGLGVGPLLGRGAGTK